MPGTGAPGAAGGRAFTYDKEFGGRQDWIDPTDPRIANYDRLSNAHRQAISDAERYRRMIEAGTGVNVPGREPELAPEIREARETFGRVYPGLAKLEQHAEVLERVVSVLTRNGGNLVDQLGRLPEVLSTHESVWEGRGRQTMTSIYTALAKDHGIEKLTPFQQSAVGNAFMGWLQSDTKLMDRYMFQDPGLTDEFLTEYRAGFIDPLRRTAQAGDADIARRNQGLPGAPRGGGLPGGGGAGGGAGAGGGQPLSADQVHDNAWKSFSAGRRAAAGG